LRRKGTLRQGKLFTMVLTNTNTNTELTINDVVAKLHKLQAILFNYFEFFLVPEDQLIQTCTDTFMAGADTTGAGLEFAMFYMVSFPEIQRKVQEEIDTIVSQNGSDVITIDERPR
jgi:hypothetical protein